MLEAAFDQYRHDVPWANDYWLSPKSVVRDMVETASDFTGYITRYNIARSEGTLLRYLSDAYRTLARTVPPEKRDEQLEDIISWLRVLVRSIDSSLVDEWEHAGTDTDASRSGHILPRPAQNRPWWRIAVDSPYWCAMPCSAVCSSWTSTSRTSSARSIRTGATACTSGGHARRLLRRARIRQHRREGTQRRAVHPRRKQGEQRASWKVRQIIDDSDGDHDWAITGTVDLDTTQSSGEVVFFDYSVSN